MIKYYPIRLTKGCFYLPAIIMMTLGLTIFPAQASTIGSFDYAPTIDPNPSALPITQINQKIAFGGTLDQLTNQPGAIVFDLVLSESDVGQTYTVSSGAAFDRAVASLTNGINDPIELMTFAYPDGFGIGEGWNEAGYFFGDPTGANGIDFSGYAINSISFKVNSLVFDTNFINGEWSSGATLSSTVTVSAVTVSAVPVPASIWLLSSGLIGIFGFRKRGMEPDSLQKNHAQIQIKYKYWDRSIYHTELK